MIKFVQHTYTKVAPHRGQKRIWLQGLKLAVAGFEKGTAYRIDYDLEYGFIELITDESGDRKVSGKKQGDGYQPIVDICNADVVDITQGEERVRVDFAKGYIRISIHHHVNKQHEREARFKKNLDGGSLTEGTLCAGAGVATAAIHQGLAEQGIESSVSWIVDREHRYLQVAADNNKAIHEDTVIFEASLEEIESELLAPVDIMQVSLPCTGHSKSGKAKNRNMLVDSLAESHQTDATAIFGLIRVVENVNPAVIISENVPESRNSASYLLIKGMLKLLGYHIHEFELDAKQAGSFEHRTRYWFVAVSEGLPQLDIRHMPAFERRFFTLDEVLESVHESDEMWSDNDYLKAKAERDELAGKNFKRHLVNQRSTYVKCIGRHYSKKRSTEAMVVRGDGKERLLTPIEHCRIKGISESLVADVPSTTAHEVLGQSILYGHGRGIGQLVALDICLPLLDGVDAIAPVSATLLDVDPARAVRQMTLL